MPVQAGSNKILKAMNRRYSREEYLGLINKIKKNIPDAVLGSDIIVGFPGETEDDLAIYSPRNGTLSAKKLEDDVTHKVKSDRLQFLMNIQKEINYEENLNYLGKEFEIITEGQMKNGDYYGRINNNKLVVFPFSQEIGIGERVNLEIKRVSSGLLFGEKVYEKV